TSFTNVKSEIFESAYKIYNKYAKLQVSLEEQKQAGQEQEQDLSKIINLNYGKDINCDKTLLAIKRPVTINDEFGFINHQNPLIKFMNSRGYCLSSYFNFLEYRRF